MNNNELVSYMRKLLNEPVEPFRKDDTHYYCGACNKRLPLKHRPRFCYRCGAMVNWKKSDFEVNKE